MNERWKPSPLLAGLFAFIAFIGSAPTLGLIGVISVTVPGYADGRPYAVQHADGTVILVGSAILGLAFAIFVYRIARKRISRAALFHASFFIGLILLGWCLWAVEAEVPVLDNLPLVGEGPEHLVETLSCPIFCLFVIPVALLFLVFAVFHDNNRNT